MFYILLELAHIDFMFTSVNAHLDYFMFEPTVSTPKTSVKKKTNILQRRSGNQEGLCIAKTFEFHLALFHLKTLGFTCKQLLQ